MISATHFPLGQHVADHGFSGAGQVSAARDLLCLEPPRVEGVIEGAPLVQAGERARYVAVLLAPRLDGPIWLSRAHPDPARRPSGAEIILELVKGGRRIGNNRN